MNERVEQAIESIRDKGYARLPSLIPEAEVARLLGRVRQLAEHSQAEEIRDIPNLDRGQETVYNLQNKDLMFLETLLGQSDIQQVLMRFLNDQWHKAIDLAEPNYILRSYSARNNRVAAPMHIDSFIPYCGELAVSMQVAIILERQTAENGCTIMIPGSHQSGEYVSQEQAEQAIPIESEAGDVVIWDSRIWHGTLPNKTQGTRWSLIATFVRWWIKQGYRITENLPQEIYAQLSDSHKAVLGYCSRPLNDEQSGIDFKKGYDWLKADVSDYRE